MQFIEDNPRLHKRPPLFYVYFDDFFHVFGHIDDDGFSGRLPFLTHKASANQDFVHPAL